MYGGNFNTHFKYDIYDMFERGERDKGANMAEYIMEVYLQRIYPVNYATTLVPAINTHVGQLMNKKNARAIIVFDDHIYSSRRRGRKASYRDKYAYEIKTCLRDNGVGFNTSQAIAWLKENPPEVVGATDLPVDKQIKIKYSESKQMFKEASEDI